MSSRAEEKEQRRAERVAAEQAEAGRAARRRRLTLLGGALALAVVVVVAAIALSRAFSSDPGETDANGVTGAAETAALLKGIPQKGAILGEASAPVTLVEYADLQCPFCKQYTLDALPTLIDDYVRTGKVRLELRLLRILGDDSDSAGRAALVAQGKDRLWNFADLFYRNQGEENSGYATDDFVAKIGSAVPGLDGKALVSGASAQGIEDAFGRSEASAQTLGVNSTPSFLLGKTGETPERLDVKTLDAGAFTGPIDAAIKSAG